MQLLDSDGLRAQSFEKQGFSPTPRAMRCDCRARCLMPDVGGLQVQVRLREVSPDTKVIVMTGRDTTAIRAAALEGGAFAFLAKPFDDEVFLSLVARALRSAR